MLNFFCKKCIMGIAKKFDTKKLCMKTWYSSKYHDQNSSILLDQNLLIFLVRNIHNGNI